MDVIHTHIRRGGEREISKPSEVHNHTEALLNGQMRRAGLLMPALTVLIVLTSIDLQAYAGSGCTPCGYRNGSE